MISIDVFSKYKVIRYIEYSYVDYEQSEPNDWVYGEHELTNVLNINGGELLDMMSTSLKDDHLISFSCNDDCIEFETFNPLDGTGDYIKITIERVDENVS